MYKCKICNEEFTLRKTNHYIARDNGKSGLASLAGGPEVMLYDAFDCPHCGCQSVIQVRKRECGNDNFETPKTLPECFGEEHDLLECYDCDYEHKCCIEAESKKSSALPTREEIDACEDLEDEDIWGCEE